MVRSVCRPQKMKHVKETACQYVRRGRVSRQPLRSPFVELNSRCNYNRNRFVFRSDETEKFSSSTPKKIGEDAPMRSVGNGGALGLAPRRHTGHHLLVLA